jgi:hypothetical protein
VKIIGLCWANEIRSQLSDQPRQDVLVVAINMQLSNEKETSLKPTNQR